MYQEIYQNIYQIKVPLTGNPLKEINSYVVKSGGECLIIDTGFNSEDCWVELKKSLDELDVDISNSILVVTHMHSDHSGLAYMLEERGAKVYTSEVDCKLIKKMSRNEYWRKFSKFATHFDLVQDGITFAAHPGDKFLPSKECKYNYIKEGDIFKIAGYEFEVVETPGHTPGQIGLYERTHKLYFGGDHILGKITPNIAYWGEGRNDLAIYEESLDKIYDYDIDIVFASHRDIVTDHKTRIDELKGHHVERLEEMLDVMDGKMSVRDVASKLSWNVRGKEWKEFPTSQKWFATSETMAHLEYLYYDGKVNKETIDEVFYYSPVENM